MIDNIMTRDSEIPAIFNPKRVRAPSVVVTGESCIEGGGELQRVACGNGKSALFIGRCSNKRFSLNLSITTEVLQIFKLFFIF